MTEDEGSVSVCVVREGDAAETFSIEVSTADLNPVEAEGTVIVRIIFCVYQLLVAVSCA